MKNEMILVATTFKGIEQVLYNELVSNGFKNAVILNRAVKFSANKYDLYRANYILSTAIRILKLIDEKKISSEEELYNFLHNIPWNHYFQNNKTFRVDVNLVSDFFTNSLYISQKSKDAIVDRFRKETGKRPYVDTKNPDVVIHIHISNKKTKVYFDSSGETLNKRGYRINKTDAPINEILARALIKMSEWDCKQPLLDIMCGSGTIPFEALYESCKIPAAFFRKSFSFMHWLDYDEKLWNTIKDIENNKICPTNTIIKGLDINHWLINQNIETKKLFPKLIRNVITFEKNDFLQKPYPFQKGIIISNLPYNERIKLENYKRFYHDVGSMLKFHYSYNKAWLLIKKDMAKYISLKPSVKYSLMNGQIECTFNSYDLY